jgi:hypothetical protein
MRENYINCNDAFKDGGGDADISGEKASRILLHEASAAIDNNRCCHNDYQDEDEEDDSSFVSNC